MVGSSCKADFYVFLGSTHLWLIMTTSEKIGPFASSDRVYSRLYVDTLWVDYSCSNSYDDRIVQTICKVGNFRSGQNRREGER